MTIYKYRLTSLGLFLATCAILTGGCSNTKEGMKEDSGLARQNAAKSLNEASEKASNASENLGAATGITPKIKMAINADSMLNQSTNRIDIDSTADTVSIVGHVTSEELKEKAGKVAQGVLDEIHSSQKINNQLEVKTTP